MGNQGKYRKDIPCVLIYAGVFQKFDKGEEVSLKISGIEGRDPLEPGDRIDWDIAQFHGTAEYVRKDGDKHIIRKI